MEIFENKDYQKDLELVIKRLPEESFSILITGATGLIGSFMADALYYANVKYGKMYEIYVMGRSAKRLSERFAYAVGDSLFHFVEQDVCESFPTDIGVDYIINAASNADPHSYALYPAETILTNILGTKNALEHAKVCGCKKVLLTSTMEVYGAGIEADVFKEDNYGKIDFNMVRSGYPESKRTAELLCRSYVDEYQVPAVIARLGYIYGPTMLKTDNKVVAQFINNILKNEDIILKSRGEQERSYLYVADTVSAIFAILFSGKSGEAYNVASSESVISICKMAEIAAEIGSCKVIHDVPSEEEKKGFSKPQNNVLCDQKLRQLGWKLEYSVRDGITQTVRILQAIKE